MYGNFKMNLNKRNVLKIATIGLVIISAGLLIYEVYLINFLIPSFAPKIVTNIQFNENPFFEIRNSQIFNSDRTDEVYATQLLSLQAIVSSKTHYDITIFPEVMIDVPGKPTRIIKLEEKPLTKFNYNTMLKIPFFVTDEGRNSISFDLKIINNSNNAFLLKESVQTNIMVQPFGNLALKEQNGDSSAMTIFAIVTGSAAIFSIFQNFYFRKKDNTNSINPDLKKHYDDLINYVYRIMLDIHIRERRGKLQFLIPYNYEEYQQHKMGYISGFRHDITLIPIDNLPAPFFNWSISHLKKGYNEIYEIWTESNKLLKEFNIEFLKFWNEVNIKLKEKINTEFPYFLDQENPDDSMKRYYLDTIYRLVKTTIDKNFMNNTKEKLDYFIIDRLASGTWTITEKGFNIYPLLSSDNKDDLDLEKFQKILEEIMNDEILINNYENLMVSRNEIGDLMSEFSTKLDEMVGKWRAGMAIQGKCEFENQKN